MHYIEHGTCTRPGYDFFSPLGPARAALLRAAFQRERAQGPYLGTAQHARPLCIGQPMGQRTVHVTAILISTLEGIDRTTVSQFSILNKIQQSAFSKQQQRQQISQISSMPNNITSHQHAPYSGSSHGVSQLLAPAVLFLVSLILVSSQGWCRWGAQLPVHRQPSGPG